MRARSKAWITLLSPLAGLLLAEGIVRVLGLEPVPMPRSEGILFKVSSNPLLTFENRPGAVRRTEYLEAAGAAPRVVEHRINALGFRGPEVSRSKPAGTYRIACVGDSHTFGTGVPEGETWPAQLQRLLEDGPAGRRVEVLNWGVSAYDTVREVILIRDRVLRFEPDLVLLQYHVNDVAGRDALGWKPPSDDFWLRWSDPRRDGWLGSLRSISQALDLSLDRIHRYRAARDESGLSLAGYAESSPGWRKVQWGLVSARDLLDERGIDFGVVLYPYLLRRGDHLSSHEAFQRVAAFCREEAIRCLDAEPAFLATDVEQLRVHAHDSHAGGHAHLLFARTVREWLSERGLPPVVERTER